MNYQCNETDPFCLSLWKRGHKEAKDGTKEDNGEALRQIMELDLRPKAVTMLARWCRQSWTDLKHGVDHEDGEDESEEKECNGEGGWVLFLCCTLDIVIL